MALSACAGLVACGAGAPVDGIDAMPPRCGDGIHQPDLGEICDQGALNGTEEATCTTECWEPRLVWDGLPVSFRLSHVVDEIIHANAYMPSGRQELRHLDSSLETTLLAPVEAVPTSFATSGGVGGPWHTFWIEPSATGSRLYCRSAFDTAPREIPYPFGDGVAGTLVQVGDALNLAVIVDHTAGPEPELLAALVMLRCDAPDVFGPSGRIGPAPGASIATIMARTVVTSQLGEHVHTVVIYDDTDRFVAFEGGVFDIDIDFAFERVNEGAWTDDIVDWSPWDPYLLPGAAQGVEAPLLMLTAAGEVLLWRFREGSPSEERSPHFGWVAPGTQAITTSGGWHAVFALEPDGTLAILFHGSTRWPLTALRRQSYPLSSPYTRARSDGAFPLLFTADSTMFLPLYAALPGTHAAHVEGIPSN